MLESRQQRNLFGKTLEAPARAARFVTIIGLRWINSVSLSEGVPKLKKRVILRNQTRLRVIFGAG
jgi:hypothetical protein